MTGKSRRAMFAAFPLLLIGLPAVAQDIEEKLYGSWRVVSFNIRRPKGPPKTPAPASVQTRPPQSSPDPTTTPVLKYKRPSLNDWRAGRLRWQDSRDERHKDSGDASVRNDKRVFGEAIEPRTQTVREHGVTFSALWHKRPPILAPSP